MYHLRTRLGHLSFPVIGPMLGLLLLLAVACGAAATAIPAAPTSAPKPTGVQSTVPAAVATATPAPTTAQTTAVVSPATVTVMIGNFGNERFDYTFASGAGHDYARQVHAFLISSDVKDGRRMMVPGIATKWEVSSDGLTWTLTIRKGVKFHDGTELTAEDVAWTLRHAIGPEAKNYASSGISQSLSKINDRIELKGPDQVSVTTTVPSSDFPVNISEATGHWIGTIYPKRASLYDAAAEAAYDRKPIGAGLLQLVRHVNSEVMSFERFADYYYQPKNGLPTDKRVNFAGLDLRLIPEEATRVAAMRAGEADIAPVSLATRKQVEAGGGRVVFAQEGVYPRAALLGCKKPPFPCQDRRVRQALAYAIDKDVMRDRLYGDEVLHVKGWGGVTPSTIGYSPELDPFPFDPNKARQLLADAGFPGGKGFGKLFVNTWASTATPFLPESAQLVADTWGKELGLDVEVKVGDQAALKKASDVSEDLYGQILWRDNETRLDAAGLLRSSYAARDVLATIHNDPELFTLVEKTLAVFDPVEKEKILNSTYRRMRDEAYDISIGYLNIPWGVAPRIQGWQPYPLALYPTALHTITVK